MNLKKQQTLKFLKILILVANLIAPIFIQIMGCIENQITGDVSQTVDGN